DNDDVANKGRMQPVNFVEYFVDVLDTIAHSIYRTFLVVNQQLTGVEADCAFANITRQTRQTLDFQLNQLYTLVDPRTVVVPNKQNPVGRARKFDKTPIFGDNTQLGIALE